MRFVACLTLALLAVSLPPHALAASSMSGLDVMSSTVLEQGQSSFSGLGLRMRLAPPGTGDALEFMPGIEYWRNTAKLDVYDIRAQRRDATLALDARYRFPGSAWRPYLGAGFGIHFLSSQLRAPLLGVPDTDHSIMKGGLALMGGATFVLAGSFETFLEGKYHFVSDYDQFKLNWGLAFNFR